MSNHLAIATVTATLRDLLYAAVEHGRSRRERDDGQPGRRPAAGAPDRAVNIFLYQVTPNAAARNEDLPTRSDERDAPADRPRVGLDLHYLLTFYGAEAQLDAAAPARRARAALHAQPVLTRAQIEPRSVAARGVPRRLEPRRRTSSS